jgi:hypothetical protein
MLSRFAGESLLWAMSNALSIFGVRDEENNPIDLPGIVGQSVENALKGVVGEEVYNDTAKWWKKLNRIVQVGSNIVWTFRTMQDTALDLMEWSVNNTGKIGNALKRFGVVGERAYRDMPESARAQERWRNKMQRFYDGLEAVESTAESIEFVTGSVMEIGEEFQQIKQQKDDLQTELTTGIPVDDVENIPIAEQTAASNAMSQSPEIPIEVSHRTD